MILLVPLLVIAKDPAPVVSPEVEQKLIRILGQTCGTGDQAEFDNLKRHVDNGTAESYLTWILMNGAPDAERSLSHQVAARRFEMRSAVLSKSTNRLFDKDTAARMRAVGRNDYIGMAETNLDRVYRGNAIRWLGEIAGADAIPAIRAATVKDTALSKLSESAIAAINTRNR
jgi:hypothetical protein